jgi:hypothetical protein
VQAIEARRKRDLEIKEKLRARAAAGTVVGQGVPVDRGRNYGMIHSATVVRQHRSDFIASQPSASWNAQGSFISSVVEQSAQAPLTTVARNLQPSLGGYPSAAVQEANLVAAAQQTTRRLDTSAPQPLIREGGVGPGPSPADIVVTEDSGLPPSHILSPAGAPLWSRPLAQRSIEQEHAEAGTARKVHDPAGAASTAHGVLKQGHVVQQRGLASYKASGLPLGR